MLRFRPGLTALLRTQLFVALAATLARVAVAAPRPRRPSFASPVPQTSSGSCHPNVTHPGVERWSIKTSLATAGAPDIAHAKLVDFAALIALTVPQPGGQPIKENDERFRDTRIPAFDNSLGVNEGDLVTVRGWLWLVATSNDDGDYHIQISGSATSGDGALIVEVPNPDPAFVSSPDLRAVFTTVREFVKTTLLHDPSLEPSACGNVMTHPPYVQVTGQLFYDDSHIDPASRGKKGMKAATSWEIHPVIDMKFAPKPNP